MKGYFVHEKGICESEKIGSGTKIWAFAHVLKGAEIGSDCNICDGVFVENDVRVGDRVTVKCGVQLWDGLRVEDDVFIGPNVTFTNDAFPRSKQYPGEFLKTVLKKGSSIGANATILPGLEIGMHAMVGAGSVVTMNVPAYSSVAGNPARILRYIESDSSAANPVEAGLPEGKTKINVKGAGLFELKKVLDMRGNISIAEFARDLPFTPKRYFVIFDVPNEKIRGQHAHRRCKQLLVCVKGSCAVVLDDGRNRQEFILNRPEKCLYIPPMVWGIQYKYSRDAVLMVFASHEYNDRDYIRNYEEWYREVNKGKR